MQVNKRRSGIQSFLTEALNWPGDGGDEVKDVFLNVSQAVMTKRAASVVLAFERSASGIIK